MEGEYILQAKIKSCVRFTYNLHGQTTSINGPGFTQVLHYADGPGTKCYNGSVSAMTWTTGSDATLRGYKYAYNGYNWLTSADYGEGASLSDRKDRYTEKSLEFMLNGGISRLQRHGLKADGIYGKVDNLHIYYDGNRISGVLEDSDPVTQNGSMDYPGKNREMTFTYNEWGALTQDESRGIADIKYDCFGNPVGISYDNGSSTENIYSASGEKLKTTHTTVSGGLTAKSVTEYRGPVIYKDGAVDMVLFPGGYATVSGGVTFHYYTQDYLGNNRAVINRTTGAIEQTISYYPYGGIIPELSTNSSTQPFKFGGKELMTANGLNEYDFGARQYYQAVPHFTRIDPMCEKYPWLSPYLYCGNNPVNAYDPTGKIMQMLKGTSVEELLNVMWNMQQITDDKLVFETQKDGSFRIKIASLGKGNKTSGTRLIRRLNSSSKTMTIGIGKENQEKDVNKTDAKNGKGSDTNVTFAPNFDPDVPVVDANGKALISKRPSYIGLSHEMIHADRSMRGVALNYSEKEPHSYINSQGNLEVENIPSEEAATIGFNRVNDNDITENDIRKEMKVKTRACYVQIRK